MLVIPTVLCLPADERNLMYVAATRAKAQLILSPTCIRVLKKSRVSEFAQIFLLHVPYSISSLIIGLGETNVIRVVILVLNTWLSLLYMCMIN